MEFTKLYDSLYHSQGLIGDDDEDIKFIHCLLNYLEQAIDDLKTNFMIESKDEFGNDIDYACYQMEIKTLYKRKEMCIDYMKSLYTTDLQKEILEKADNDDMYKQLAIIFVKWLGDK